MNLDDPHLFKPRSPDYRNAPQMAAVPTYQPIPRAYLVYMIFLLVAGLGLLVWGISGTMSMDNSPTRTPYTTPAPTP